MILVDTVYNTGDNVHAPTPDEKGTVAILYAVAVVALAAADASGPTASAAPDTDCAIDCAAGLHRIAPSVRGIVTAGAPIMADTTGTCRFAM